jgi:predicted HTH transcriptional regulator
VAKYATTTREHLVEKAELGNCSLIKAAKSVLEKVNIENRTFVKITSKERIEKRMWHPVALREAIINAFVHADYTLEIPPKFELFPDRIEITSAGGLLQNLTEEEFFEGYSVPRNKELMRVFKDLELVEQLGTGIPRILQYYGKECFKISPNFIRIVFPADKEVVKHVQEKDLIKKLPGKLPSKLPSKSPSKFTQQVTDQVMTKLLTKLKR